MSIGHFFPLSFDPCTLDGLFSASAKDSSSNEDQGPGHTHSSLCSVPVDEPSALGYCLESVSDRSVAIGSMYEKVDGQRTFITAFGGNARHCFRYGDAVGKLIKNLPSGSRHSEGYHSFLTTSS